MTIKYTSEEMRIRDEFAAVALRYWMEEFTRIKERKPDASFFGFKGSLARASFYMADSMMEARQQRVEIKTSNEM